MLSEVPENVKKNGYRFYREGAVLELNPDSKGAEALIADDEGGFERVRLTLRNGTLSVKCSCHAARTCCSHVFAAALAWAAAEPDRIPEEESRFLDQFCKADEEHDEGQAESPEAIASPVSADREERDALGLPEQGFRGRLCLVFDGDLNALETRWQLISVRGHLEFDGRKYALRNTVALVDEDQAAAGMTITDFPPADRQIIEFLVKRAWRERSVFQFSAPHAADFFHCLVGFDNAWWSGRRLGFYLQPVEIVLLHRRIAERRHIKPRIRIPDRGVLDQKPDYIRGVSGAWIGAEGQYWWLPACLDPAWFKRILKGSSFSLSDGEFDLIRKTPRELFPVQLIEVGQKSGNVEAVAFEKVPPVPVLSLDWKRETVWAELRMNYNGRRVLPGHVEPVAVGQRLLLPHPDVERAAAERLTHMGLKPSPGRDNEYVVDDEASIWTFLHERLPALLREWEVFWSPQFEKKKNQSRELTLQISSGKESGNWFEVFCRGLTTEGMEIDWEAVITAAAQEKDHVRATDGSVVRIPEHVKRAVQLLLQQCRTREGGTHRFSMHSAIPVSTAMQPYNVDQSARWQKLRDHLLEAKERRDVRLPLNVRTVLRDYQVEGVAWLSCLEQAGLHGILADEMGLGKTVQVLAAISRRRHMLGSTAPSLVVCPTSLIENWICEAERFVPELPRLAIHGKSRQPLLDRIPEQAIVVTSYALLRRDIAYYRECNFDYLVLDEAQHIKNPYTANARVCKEVDGNHRLVLTGTPMENRLSELWSLFDFLVPGMLGAEKEFRQNYEQPVKNGDMSVAEKLAARTAPLVLRRTKENVLQQLPPKIEQDLHFDLYEEQQQIHESLLAAGRTLLSSAQRAGDNWQQQRIQLLALLVRLRQLCAHPALLPADVRGEDENIPSAKTDLLEEVLQEAMDDGHRVLLFSQFTSFLKVFARRLEELDVQYEYIDGATKERHARVETFNNDPSIPVFLLSLKAAGTGLNLTGADTVILYDQWWNPMVEDQATDRTHRIGQDKPVTVYRPVAQNSVEERIRQLQDHKRELFIRYTEGVPANLDQLATEDFEYLFGET